MIRNPIETAAGEAFGGEPEPFEARPIAWRLIVALLVIEAIALVAFILWVTR